MLSRSHAEWRLFHGFRQSGLPSVCSPIQLVPASVARSEEGVDLDDHRLLLNPREDCPTRASFSGRPCSTATQTALSSGAAAAGRSWWRSWLLIGSIIFLASTWSPGVEPAQSMPGIRLLVLLPLLCLGASQDTVLDAYRTRVPGWTDEQGSGAAKFSTSCRLTDCRSLLPRIAGGLILADFVPWPTRSTGSWPAFMAGGRRHDPACAGAARTGGASPPARCRGCRWSNRCVDFFSRNGRAAP